MDIVSVIISLVSGAVGGNVAGGVMKEKSLGTLGNSLAGILGGGIGGAILQFLGMAANTADASGVNIAGIVEQIAGGGVGGAVLLAIVSMLKKAAGPSAK